MDPMISSASRVPSPSGGYKQLTNRFCYPVLSQTANPHDEVYEDAIQEFGWWVGPHSLSTSSSESNSIYPPDDRRMPLFHSDSFASSGSLPSLNSSIPSSSSSSLLSQLSDPRPVFRSSFSFSQTPDEAEHRVHDKTPSSVDPFQHSMPQEQFPFPIVPSAGPISNETTGTGYRSSRFLVQNSQDRGANIDLSFPSGDSDFLSPQPNFFVQALNHQCISDGTMYSASSPRAEPTFTPPPPPATTVFLNAWCDPISTSHCAESPPSRLLPISSKLDSLSSSPSQLDTTSQSSRMLSQNYPPCQPRDGDTIPALPNLPRLPSDFLAYGPEQASKRYSMSSLEGDDDEGDHMDGTESCGSLSPSRTKRARTLSAAEEDAARDRDTWWGIGKEAYMALPTKSKKQLRNKLGARRFRERRKERLTELEGKIHERDQALLMVRQLCIEDARIIHDLRTRLAAYDAS